jgi:general secretion pathway protein F
MSTQRPPAVPISLQDLIALNDEIAALVRAGIPLEVGLGATQDLPTKLQGLTERLRRQMEQGASLPTALRSCGADLPPSYLALVEAGIKSNRLTDALVSAAAFCRALLEMQQQARSALVYPLLVLCVAYAFFLFLLHALLPRIVSLLVQAGTPPGRLLEVLESMSATAWLWGPLVPFVAIVAALWTGILPSSIADKPAIVLLRLRWVPWLRRILRDVQSASYCHLLGILVDRAVPLPDALELAASASGDKPLLAECRRIAADLRRGVPLDQAMQTARRLPAFTRWLMSAGQGQGELPSVMATVADIYRRRARSQMELFRMSAPLVLTVILGGGAVAAYAILLFLPMRNLFMDLSNGP